MKLPRRSVRVGLCVLLLGCLGRSGPGAIREYALGGAGGSSKAAAGDRRLEGSHADLTLRLAEVSAAPWLTRDGIYYRLAYHDAARVAPYAESRWVAPAPRMLEAMLADALECGHAWKAVIGPGDDAVADVMLSLQLLELVQEFTSPSRSDAVLRARATLTDARSRSVIAQRAFDYRVEAPSPDAAGGVRAERLAGDRLAHDVAAWAAGLAIPRGPEGSGAPAGKDGDPN